MQLACPSVKPESMLNRLIVFFPSLKPELPEGTNTAPRESSSFTTMDVGPCWSSLPPELLSHIADCFLATNDIDYYMGFRAVCRDWRHATDDPINTWDVRFRPCRWIVFREKGSCSSHIFVNTSTGRFHRKDMPLLSKYDQVAAAKGGFLVLKDKISGHGAVHILNPFTGYLAYFMELSTSSVGILRSASTVFGSPPTLVLSDRRGELHRADLDGKHTSLSHENRLHRHLIWQAIGNGAYGPMGRPFSEDDLLEMFSSDQLKMFRQHHGFLVESDGEALMVLKHETGGMEVFKVDAACRKVSGPVKSIGDDRAIFVGICKSVSIDASKFPSIHGDCIYHVKATDTYPYHDMICRYDMKKGKEEMVCRAEDTKMVFEYNPKGRPEMVCREVDTGGVVHDRRAPPTTAYIIVTINILFG
uniref:Uncharacterized protein n=1 Tax=Avena sativa TaxID=4498 RepID=A0ACD5YZQ2_AVESA